MIIIIIINKYYVAAVPGFGADDDGGGMVERARLTTKSGAPCALDMAEMPCLHLARSSTSSDQLCRFNARSSRDQGAPSSHIGWLLAPHP
jgi:hypothetical protein